MGVARDAATQWELAAAHDAEQQAGLAAVSHGHDYLAPVMVPFHLPTRIYGAMLVVWHLRPVLQRRFPLQRGAVRDFLRFLAWCASEGRREYAILRSIPEWDAELARPVDLPALRRDRWSGIFCVGMFLFGVARGHYAFGRILTSATERHRIARLYWRGDRHLRFFPAPEPWQRLALERRFGSPQGLAAAIGIERLDVGKDLDRLVAELGLAGLFGGQARDAASGQGPGPGYLAPEVARVRLPASIRRSPVRLPLKGAKTLGWALDRMAQRPSEFELASVTARITVARRPPPRFDGVFGVNLFGYAKGELGIGEDVRMLALALKANGVPFCIVDVKLGSSVSQLDASVERWLSDEPRYPINVFCMTGIEHARLVCERGLDMLRGRYTIGLWPWELPDWPASCRYVCSVVDEIWGISRYTAGAYRAAPCPVYPMSLPVIAEPIGAETRSDFGLPEDVYLFLFAFDLHSTLARKNPAGVVRAFLHAFPAWKRERVGLVIKVSHSESAKGQRWEELLALIRSDHRIRLVDATLRKASLLALYRCCDCFVSLHRAEGFGRSIAEAILLGMPVIATRFSGNLDYCHEDQVDLVPYQLRELGRHEYFWGEGQQWADPDVAVAAQLMRRRMAGERQPMLGGVDFSPARVGERYARRLAAIYDARGPRDSRPRSS